MKVVLASLTWQEKIFTLADDGWFPSEVIKTGPVAAAAGLRRLDASASAASWSLAGHLRVAFSLPCDRCGRELRWPVDDHFVYRLVMEDSGAADGEVDDEAPPCGSSPGRCWI